MDLSMEMTTLDLQIDGKRVRVKAQKLNGFLWFHFAGQTYRVKPEEPVKRKTAKTGARDGTVVAQMPGRVVQVLVKAHDLVVERQPLVVMEAMKMEFTLESPGPGQVESVLCQPQDQVQIGQRLVIVNLTSSAESDTP
jgi:3-methylcrotonyl-CoA carboxylase alpha subunit